MHEDTGILLSDLNRHFAEGNFEESEGLCYRILRIEPVHRPVTVMLGIILHGRGATCLGVRTVNRVLALYSEDIYALNALAGFHLESGEYRKACSVYLQIIGILASGTRSKDDRLISACCNGAARLTEAGRKSEGQTVLYAVLRIFPAEYDPLLCLLYINSLTGDETGSEDIYRRCSALNKDDYKPHYYMGIIFAAKEPERAGKYLCRALAYTPATFNLLLRLGHILYKLSDNIMANRILSLCLVLEKDSWETSLFLAQVKIRLEDFEAAFYHYLKALKLKPYYPEVFHDLPYAGLSLPVFPETPEAIDRERARLKSRIRRLYPVRLRIDDPMQASRTNFYLAYHNRSNLEINREIAEYLLKACPLLGRMAPGVDKRAANPGSQRHVGIVANITRGTTNRYFSGLIARLRCENLHITLFCVRHYPHRMWDILAPRVDRIVVLPDDYRKAVEIVSAHEPDILLYTEIGMDDLPYFMAFARLAPIQCALYGHPDTTGIPNIDYFLSPAIMEPEDGDSHYAERLIRLPALTSYFSRETGIADVTPEELGIESGKRLYLCPQFNFKIHPDLDLMAGEILDADPEGLLLLFNHPLPGLKGTFEKRLRLALGDNLRRVRWLGELSLPKYLGLLRLADAVLDSPHFTGGGSSYQALGIGVPVVTLEGAFMRGRQTAGLYATMGIGGPVAQTPREYVDIALKLSANPTLRLEYGTRILNKSAVLFEDETSVEALRDFLAKAKPLI